MERTPAQRMMPPIKLPTSKLELPGSGVGPTDVEGGAVGPLVMGGGVGPAVVGAGVVGAAVVGVVGFSVGVVGGTVVGFSVGVVGGTVVGFSVGVVGGTVVGFVVAAVVVAAVDDVAGGSETLPTADASVVTMGSVVVALSDETAAKQKHTLIGKNNRPKTTVQKQVYQISDIRCVLACP